MKVLVTGANGFVGKDVVRELKQNGLSVVSLLRANGNQRQQEEVIFMDDFKSRSEWKKALEGVDVVVHLIARTHNTSEKGDEAYNLYRDTNVAITEVLCDAIVESSVHKLIFLSSIKVNGENTFETPFCENSVEAPEDNYGLTKKEAEHLIKEKLKDGNADYIIIRPPLIYGDELKGNLATLLKIIQKKIPFPFRCVHNARSLVTLSALSRFIALVAREKDIKNEIVLVADTKTYTTAGIVSKIASDHDENCFQFCVPMFVLELLFGLLRIGGLKKKLLLNLEVDNSKARRLAESYGCNDIFESK